LLPPLFSGFVPDDHRLAAQQRNLERAVEHAAARFQFRAVSIYRDEQGGRLGWR